MEKKAVIFFLTRRYIFDIMESQNKVEEVRSLWFLHSPHTGHATPPVPPVTGARETVLNKSARQPVIMYDSPVRFPICIVDLLYVLLERRIA